MEAKSESFIPHCPKCESDMSRRTANNRLLVFCESCRFTLFEDTSYSSLDKKRKGKEKPVKLADGQSIWNHKKTKPANKAETLILLEELKNLEKEMTELVENQIRNIMGEKQRRLNEVKKKYLELTRMSPK